MQVKEQVDLSSERLLLRQYQLSDAIAMFKNYANDEDVCRYITWAPYTDVKDVESFLKGIIAKYNSADPYWNWAICDVKTGEVIGNISVVNFYPDIETAELGYVLGKKYWNQGLMSEALSLVMEFLFTKCHMHRLMAKHHALNLASGRVLAKAGMIKEGYMRQACKHKGEYIDYYQYAILASDYFA